MAARALAGLGVTVGGAPARLVPGKAVQMPFEPAAKEALEQSVVEADRLGHGLVGTEHVLLGLCASAESETLRVLGVPPARIRDEVLRLLSGNPE